MAKAKPPKPAKEKEEAPAGAVVGRPIWSGAISFGLITIPIKLHTGVRDKDIHFNMLHATDKSRVEQKVFCVNEQAEISRKDTVKGFEIAPDQYVVVSPDEMAAAAPKASRTIELISFVKVSEIDPMYFDKPYYVLPGEHGAKAYHLLIKALGKSGRAALGRFVMRNKEYLTLIRPTASVLCLETLHHGDEVILSDSLAGLAPKVDVTEAEIKMAQQLVESLAGAFEPSKLKDNYREALEQIIQRKAEGKEVITQASSEEEAPEVIDLMAALQKSLEAAQKKQKQSRVA